jgi:hypothetical protein
MTAILSSSQSNNRKERTTVVYGVALGAATLEELLSVVDVSRGDISHV